MNNSWFGKLASRRRAGLLVALLSLAWVAAAAAPLPTPPTPAPASPQGVAAPAGHALTADDVAAFVDGLAPAELATAEVPGAVVVVVKDGQVLFEKGYGYSDYKKGTPVDPRLTLFRPGSISKLFTWTAVMQLVQAGKIDLDADVNRYLDFRIPRYHGLPVTMRELMTHRAGFSETARGLIAFGRTPAPLGEVMKRYVPPRIFAPDEGPGYSNYGASLAGYIVQRVSGEPFDAYIARHILQPLGMAHSTFDQPLPPALAPEMSQGYVNWNRPGKGFEIIDMPPAGALSSTGDDMAKFMIAHLQLGQAGGAQILSPAIARMMHETAWKAFPDLNGNLLGFYQQNVNGHRVIAHGGDTNYFHSDLSLFIDDNVGLFVSVNAVGKAGEGEFLRERLFQGFADRYFPRAAPLPPSSVSLAAAKADAKLIAGVYRTTRRTDSTFLSIIPLIGPTVVRDDGDGTISVAPLLAKETFVEVRPFLWRQLNGPDRLQATLQGGRVARWATDSTAPIFVYVRQPGLAGAGLALPFMEAALAWLVITAILWPVTAIARRRYRASFAHSGARAVAYRLVRVGAVFAIAAILFWFFTVQMAAGTSGGPVETTLHVAQALSAIAFVGGTMVAIWNLAMAFGSRSGWGARLFAVLTLAAYGYMLWFALAYHLIGVSTQF